MATITLTRPLSITRSRLVPLLGIPLIPVWRTLRFPDGQYEIESARKMANRDGAAEFLLACLHDYATAGGIRPEDFELMRQDLLGYVLDDLEGPSKQASYVEKMGQEPPHQASYVEKMADLVAPGQRVLLHGTTLDAAKKILEQGLLPKRGPWTSKFHGDGEPIAFGADMDDDPEDGGSSWNWAVFRALKFHVGQKIGKGEEQVTVQDVIQNGAILEVVFDKLHRAIPDLDHPDEVLREMPPEEAVERMPAESDPMAPTGVEQNDLYSKDPGQPVGMIVGQDLATFIVNHAREWLDVFIHDKAQIYTLVEHFGGDMPEIEGEENPYELAMHASAFVRQAVDDMDENFDSSEPETVEVEQPQDDDIIITDNRGYAAYQSGKMVASADDYDECLWNIKQYMDRSKYWPNVWLQEERGGYQNVSAEVSQAQKPPPSDEERDRAENLVMEQLGEGPKTRADLEQAADGYLDDMMALDLALSALVDTESIIQDGAGFKLPPPEPSAPTEMGIEDVPGMHAGERSRRMDSLLDLYSRETDPARKQQLEQQMRSLRAFLEAGWTKTADVESRAPILVKQFPSLQREGLDPVEFLKNLADAVDPTGQNGKYLSWIMSAIEGRGWPKPEQFGEAKELLKSYDKAKGKKGFPPEMRDINRLSPKQVMDAVEQYGDLTSRMEKVREGTKVRFNARVDDGRIGIYDTPEDATCPECGAGFGDIERSKNADGKPSTMSPQLECKRCAHRWTLTPKHAAIDDMNLDSLSKEFDN